MLKNNYFMGNIVANNKVTFDLTKNLNITEMLYTSQNFAYTFVKC